MQAPLLALKESEGKCELLGPFAILIQISLGALAISSLLYKRHLESPRRPFKVWGFDVSKQVFGAVVVHFVNIAMSNLAHDVGGSRESPCTWYFLNILVDTTIGVAILWYALRTLDAVCVLLSLEGLNSGDYGNPPKVSYWLKQACVYTIGLLLMKFAVFLILHVVPQLGGIGSFLLRWTEFSERLRIVVVMAVFPLIMNVVQYIIIDNIVKAPSKTVPPTDEANAGESSRLLAHDV